ncbi:MAG TPA: SUMF1/EgtB/PvdO family nonheme iron enzyme [Blastocatellia bacterium]|nr:SUMF1/EgtB/PvdO family nonheme iron enzyme [Blastocatellia bacterium]
MIEKSENDFDVALSFAGEDRAFVESVAETLKQNKVNVFYDHDEEIYLWGKDLGDALDEIYRLRSKYVVAFISKDYAGKMWTNHERRSAFARALEEKREYVLPARFDDTELANLPPTIAYIDLRKETPESFALKIIKKLALSESLKRKNAPASSSPANHPVEELGEADRMNQPMYPGAVPRKSTGIEVVVARRAIRAAGAVYCFIPKGKFPMGSDNDYEHERPRHLVYLPSFFMAATPVRNADFATFTEDAKYVTSAEENGFGFCLRNNVWEFARNADWRHPAGPHSTITGKGDHPVAQVSWHDAKEYCKWLSTTSGFHFDLPTEAQWEYAAAGSRGRIWSFGNTYEQGMANLEGGGTSSVASFPPNEFGLFDMTGNVYEWCSDWYAPAWAEAGHLLNEAMTTDPQGPPTGQTRVLKGGSWFDTPRHSRNSHRFDATPYLSAGNWGFRCLLSLTDELLAELINTREWGLSIQQMF